MIRPRFSKLMSVCLSTMLGCALTAPALAAADYPNRPIRVIVPFPAGSTTDAITRYLGEQVGKRLGTSFVVENRGGASGTIGAREFIRSEPDGYTLFMASNSTHAANKHLFKNPGYDPQRDFVGITQVSINPLVLVANPDLPVKDVRTFVDYAKRNPGKLNYGVGNSSSLAGVELIKIRTGIDAQDITYPGTPQAITDVVGGRVQFMMTDVSVTRPFIESGRLRALGVATAMPLPALPGVQPIGQSGIDGYDFSAWNGLFGRAGTPAHIVDKLNAAFVAAINDPASQPFFAKLGVIPTTSSPQQFARFVQDQITLWGEIVEKAGLPKQ